jgi:hypothetical protein
MFTCGYHSMEAELAGGVAVFAPNPSELAGRHSKRVD